MWRMPRPRWSVSGIEVSCSLRLFSLYEFLDLPGDGLHQPLSRLHCGPCDMRGDEQPALICDSEQRAVFRHRFFAEDIQTGSQDFMIVQGIGEICSIPTAPAVQLAYYNYDGVFRTSLPLEGTPYSRKKR